MCPHLWRQLRPVPFPNGCLRMPAWAIANFLPEHPAEHSKHSNIDIRLTSFGGPCCLTGWARRSFEGEGNLAMVAS
jgi:hypothetical protein